ncbi:MAG TPA: MEDS domain-containing protein [Thermoleophilaceae bacterium]|nr:MEDS domain-containing protein [Thermoleophilaceae bacterium]
MTVRRGEHACCHFRDGDDRERFAVAFVRAALRRGDKVVYLFDGDDAAGLISRLERADAGFAPAAARGQFQARRSREAYIPDGQFDPGRMVARLRDERDVARAEGYPGLSVAGELPTGFCEAPGGELLGAYEALLASGIDAGSYSILCQYDPSRFGAEVLSQVIESHEVDASPDLAPIGRDGDLAAVRDRGRGALRLAGELDFGSAQALAEVLAHFDGPVRLDLADLSYVDVTGMRALRGRNGQRLTISRSSGAVRQLAALLGWDTDPAIEFLDTG